MNELLLTVLTLSVLGALLAIVLYFVAKRFKVDEDPRIDEVETMLPGANCGGCGFAGCRAMAEALVMRDDISSLNCPVGGGSCMRAIAQYLDKEVAEAAPKVATLRCGGTCAKRPKNNVYDGEKSCAVVGMLYVGETSCVFGCIGYGDCVKACQFGALNVNKETGLVEVDVDKCTACGACVKACPRGLIELRKKWPKNRAIYVACRSTNRGSVVMKVCKAGCIGCGKCEKACPFGAITVDSYLAYIDSEKCKLCRKCVNECPTGAINIVNMERLPREAKPVAPKPAAATTATPVSQSGEETKVDTAKNE